MNTPTNQEAGKWKVWAQRQIYSGPLSEERENYSPVRSKAREARETG